MADSIIKKVLICIFLILSSLSFAKTDDIVLSENEDVKAEDNWQILMWDRIDGDVYKYNVIIEKYNGHKKSWFPERTVPVDGKCNSLKVIPALDLGYYRYRVNAMNIIGIEDVSSEWMEFKIYKAFTPKISSVTVDVSSSSSIFLEEENDGCFTVRGKNLFNQKNDEKDISYTSYFLVNSQNTKKKFSLVPVEVKNGKEVSFKLNLDELETGTYDIIAVDASGLKSESDSGCKLHIRYRKEFDFDVSAGYVFPVILFDKTLNEYLGKQTLPASGFVKASYIHEKKRSKYFGMGSEFFYSRMNSNKENYEISGNYISLFLTFVYQKPFFYSKNKLLKGALEFRGGPGFEYISSLRFNFNKGIETKPLNSINPAFLAGISYQYYLTRRLYLECGMDFSMAFMKDMYVGMVRPAILIGWQF